MEFKEQEIEDFEVKEDENDEYEDENNL